ncbi:hypothetical protein [Gracilibacillus sp. Marseille-QA3620]
MIEKILLYQHPNIEIKPADYLCGAMLIFKGNQPIIHSSCDILLKDGDLYLGAEGWGITNESVIKKIQMYVRNKIDVIEAGKLPTFEEACQQVNIILRKRGDYFGGEFGQIDSPNEEQGYETEIDIQEVELHENMQAIVNKVNDEWKK